MLRNKILWVRKSSAVGVRILTFSLVAALYFLGSGNFVAAVLPSEDKAGSAAEIAAREEKTAEDAMAEATNHDRVAENPSEASGAEVTATFDPATVSSGEETGLRITVKNTDKERELPLQHLVIDLNGLKDNFEYIDNKADKGVFEITGNALGVHNWQVGRLDPGQTALLRVGLKARENATPEDILLEGEIVAVLPEEFATNCREASASEMCRPAVTVKAEKIAGGVDALKEVVVSVTSDKLEVMPGEEASYEIKILDSSVEEVALGAVVRLDLSSIARGADFKPMLHPLNGDQGSTKEIAAGIWEWTLGNGTEQIFSFAVKVKEKTAIGTQLTAKVQSIKLKGDDSVTFVTKDTCEEIFKQNSRCFHSVSVVEDSRPDPRPGANGLAIRVYVGDGKSPKAQVRQGDTISYLVTAKNNGSIAISDTVIEDNLQNIIGSADIVEDSLVGFVYDKNNGRVTWPKIAAGGGIKSHQSDKYGGYTDDDDRASNFIRPAETLELTYKVKAKKDAKVGSEISNKVSTVPLASPPESVFSPMAGVSNCMPGSTDSGNCSATVTIVSAAAPAPLPGPSPSDGGGKGTLTGADKGKKGLASTGFSGQNVITAALLLVGSGGGMILAERRKRFR